jgi:hypothetical protein
MSVGFGFSAGEFIAALKLVGDVIDALRDSGNASSSFRSLINELYALESALIRVKRLDLDPSLHVQELALRQAASQCQRSIDDFWKKAQKYQPHLQTNGTNSRIKDAWYKVQWALCGQEDVQKFEAELRGHTSSIEILLMTVQLETTKLESKRRDEQGKGIASAIQFFLCQAMDKFTSLASGMTQSLSQGKILLEATTTIVNNNLRVFQILHDIQLYIMNVPGQVQRQQPIEFTDVFNRVYPIHLEFVRSVDELLAVMKVKFKRAGCDSGVLDRGNFVLEETGSQVSIDLRQPWESCLFPGQRVAMSVVIHLPKTQASSCPRCGTSCIDSEDKDTVWYVLWMVKSVRLLTWYSPSCRATFRRIEELSERSAADASIGNTGHISANPIMLEAYSPGTKRRGDDSDPQQHNGLTKFRRLRIIDQKVAPFGNSPAVRRLLRSAQDADHIAGGLQLFLDHIPERETDLEECIEDLLAMSFSLREIAQNHPDFDSVFPRLSTDMQLCSRSFGLTFNRIRTMFGETRYPKKAEERPYRRAWEGLDDYFVTKEQGPTLLSRLQAYEVFVQSMLRALRG